MYIAWGIFNRKGISWPFQPLKSKFGVKNCVPKRTVFANPVTYSSIALWSIALWSIDDPTDIS